MTTASTSSAISLFKQQVKDAREFLEGTMSDVTQEGATGLPGGAALSIGANYAHIVTSQDMGLAMLKGSAPLIASTWAARSGLSEPPPFGPGTPLDQWSRTVKIDLGTLRQYAAAVYAATDEHLASISSDDFSRPFDLSALGLGQQPASFILLAGWVNNVLMHCGEISCLKGLRGQKGYPV